MSAPSVRPSSDQDGYVGGLEALAFGVVIFVVGTLIVLNAWSVVDAKLAVEAAAREAARAAVEAPADVTDGGAEGVAAAAASAALQAHRPGIVGGLDALSGSRGRCAELRATVSAAVPTVRVPIVGVAAGTTTVTGDHVEVVDPYRSGFEGEASCAFQ